MKLAPMRYKTYTWPYNPRVYVIEFERNVAVHKVPFGRCHLQDLGPTRRVMRGEGEFLGPGAYDEFKKLASVFLTDGPGLLVHPVWQTTNAHFVELKLTQEPRENYVRYTFTFWEDYAGYTAEPVRIAGKRSPASGFSAAETKEKVASGQVQYHTVVQGECLWGIAAHYGVALNDLIALNPRISNPNLIYPGQQVRVA